MVFIFFCEKFVLHSNITTAVKKLCTCITTLHIKHIYDNRREKSEGIKNVVYPLYNMHKETTIAKNETSIHFFITPINFHFNTHFYTEKIH